MIVNKERNSMSKAPKLQREVCEKLVATYIATSEDKEVCIALMSYVCSKYAPDYKYRSIVNRYAHLRALDNTVDTATEFRHKKYSLFETVAQEMLPHRFI